MACPQTSSANIVGVPENAARENRQKISSEEHTTALLPKESACWGLSDEAKASS
jgi:hypothetical protein